MSGHESDEEGQPIVRSPRSHYAGRRNVPVSNNHPNRRPAPRPQVHQQMPPQLQSSRSQRSTPPQDHYHAVYASQVPASHLRGVGSSQQHHGGTHRIPSTDDEAQTLRESRHERLPGFTPHHGPFQNMRPGASQYPTTFTTRAVSGSSIGEDAPYLAPISRQIRNNRSGPFGVDPELHTIHRQSANPMVSSPATSDYPYPQELDLSSGQPSQVNSAYGPSAAYTSDIPAYNTHGSFRPYIPQSPSGATQYQHNNLPVDPQYQRSMQRSTTLRNPTTTTNYSNSRCRYGCSAPPGYHCDHEREER